jgi:hypothetical protein
LRSVAKTYSFGFVQESRQEVLVATQRTIYRIENWKEYNKSLVNRGRITLWLSDDIENSWVCQEASGKRGRPKQYSDVAIELCLTVKYLYKLPYRATQGFVDSFLERFGFSLQSPCYSQINRRSPALAVKLKRISTSKEKLDIVVDSTGLKVYGEGEWKVRTHGAGKRRTWRKLHLGVDPLDHEIVSWELTGNDKSDDQVFPDVLKGVEGEVERCFGDGAYDKKPCYDACYARQVSLITPPRIDAVPQKQNKINPSMIPRDRAIERIKSLEKTLGDTDKARKQWKHEIDYHTRSIAETAMFRFKTICSGNLASRNESSQKTEVAIKINLLNAFTACGMPRSYPLYLEA